MAKYRPSLTDRQIRHIIALAKTESPLSTDSIELIAKLASFVAKIEVGAVYANPAVICLSNAEILESLGGGLIAPISLAPNHTNHNHTNTHPSNISYQIACYDSYQANPAECTMKEIEIALDYAYTNDLMSSEEIRVYESQAATGVSIRPADNNI